MNNVQKIKDYEFLTSKELAKEIAARVKVLRKKQFSSQALFAKHIGMPKETYARFEKTGLISFVGLISVARGLDTLEDITELFTQNNEIIEW